MNETDSTASRGGIPAHGRPAKRPTGPVFSGPTKPSTPARRGAYVGGWKVIPSDKAPEWWNQPAYRIGLVIVALLSIFVWHEVSQDDEPQQYRIELYEPAGGEGTP